MDKKEIVKSFLKEGVLLSPDDLEKINKENYEQILESKKGKPKTEKKKDTSTTVKKTAEDTMSTEDFIKAHNKKFEFLRDILTKKTEAVSINKGKKIFSEVTVIGRVKEKTQRGFIIEDVTGETEVIGEDVDVNDGDVLAIRGLFKDNRLLPVQVTWPDVPLENGLKPIESKITLTTMKKEGMNGLVVCPDKSLGAANCMEIQGEGENIRIMAYHPGEETNEEGAVKMLKRRLTPEEKIPDNTITEIPNIFWLFNNKRNWSKNYKGVVIISTDEDSSALYEAGLVRFEKL